MGDRFQPFEEKIGIKFNDKGLLQEAFTHRSYINENRDVQSQHNERLEFLGDAVLELVVTHYLFHKYPEKAEGDLTSYRAALVNTQSIAQGSELWGVNEFMLLSKGEAKDTGKARQYILADAFEAIIGAIYLDQGYEAAKGFIEKSLFHKTDEIVAKELWKDAKSRFQELSQEKVSITPAYHVLREDGPDHEKEFTVGVYLGEELVCEGAGRSKQDAEQQAAGKAIQVKNWE